MNALMRRRFFNLGLLILVGGLVALAWFEPGREHPGVIPLWLKASPTRIEHIEAWRPDRETLAFVRRDGHWWMTAPSSGLANPILLNQLLQEVATHCPLQYPVAGLDLKALHLDPPQLRLRLDDQEIYFGATTPTDGLRYLQAGAIVYLCPDRLYRLLSSAAASFLAPPIEPPESLKPGSE